MSSSAVLSEPTEADAQRRQRAGRLKLLFVVLICALPVIASYFTYYVIQPSGRTNYGQLVDPQLDVSSLAGQTPLKSPNSASTAPTQEPSAAAAQKTVADLRGKWVMMTLADARCEADCAERLWKMRQVRLTMNDKRERIERLVLLVDHDGLPPALALEHPGLHQAKSSPEWQKLLASVSSAVKPADDAGSSRAGTADDPHIYLIDPLGNLMLRFPAQADPSRMKKDLNKLLKASRIG